MAYNEEEDDIFGISDTKLIEDDLFGDKPVIKPETALTPASDEDKQLEQQSGKAKTDKELKAEADKKKKAEEALDPLKVEEDLFGGDKQPKNTKPAQQEPVTTNDDEFNDIEAFATDLFEKGILTRDSEEEELPSTMEELMDKMSGEGEKIAIQRIESFASKHGDEYRDFFDAVFVDGVHPDEYFAKHKELTDFSSLDMTLEDNQVKVVETALRKQGLEPDQISKKIRSLKLNAELENDALMYQGALVKSQEKELITQREQSKLKLEQKAAAENYYKTTIQNLASEKLKGKDFDGVPITKEVASGAYKMLTEKRWKDPNTGYIFTDFDYAMRELDNPKNLATKFKLAAIWAHMYGSEGFKPGQDIKFDVAPVAKKAVSEENKDTYNFLKRKKVGQVQNKRETQEVDFFKDL